MASAGCEALGTKAPPSDACLIFSPIYMSAQDHATMSVGLLEDIVYHNEQYAAICPEHITMHIRAAEEYGFTIPLDAAQAR